MQHINCPTCGAKTNQVILNCEYCGSTLTPNSTLKPSDYIEALQRRLDSIQQSDSPDSDKHDEQLSAIRMFTMPSEIQCLIEFLTFCDGNAVMENTDFDSEQAELISAWKGKATAAYNKLRIASVNNPDITSFLKDYSSRYSAEAVETSKKTERNNQLIGYVVLLVIVILSLTYCKH